VTVLEQIQSYADWDSRNLQKLPEAEFRNLVVQAIADLARRTEILREAKEKTPEATA
jgi:hypothetical protein